MASEACNLLIFRQRIGYNLHRFSTRFIIRMSVCLCLRIIMKISSKKLYKFQLLDQVTKQCIVFIEFGIINITLVHFFHQHFIVRFAL